MTLSLSQALRQAVQVSLGIPTGGLLAVVSRMLELASRRHAGYAKRKAIAVL